MNFSRITINHSQMNGLPCLRLPFTALMTIGHLLTSQIFAAHINKSTISNIYAMPDSGIPGKRAFDTVVMGENQQLMGKISVSPRPEEVKNGHA